MLGVYDIHILLDTYVRTCGKLLRHLLFCCFERLGMPIPNLDPNKTLMRNGNRLYLPLWVITMFAFQSWGA